jgi:hypothetical protein
MSPNVKGTIKDLSKVMLGLVVGIGIGWLFTTILEAIFNFINLDDLL